MSADPATINTALAELFGIDAGAAVSFVVDVDKERLPLVTVTYRFREPVAGQIVDRVKAQYRLVPVDDESGSS